MGFRVVIPSNFNYFFIFYQCGLQVSLKATVTACLPLSELARPSTRRTEEQTLVTSLSIQNSNPFRFMLVHPQQVTEDDNSPPTNTAAHMNLDHFNVIVVGQAGIGKSSLIKLLLDTSHLSKNTTPPQLACLAEFANFAATCPTNSPSSIIAQLATLQNDRDLLLTLIDTPGLLYHDSNELEAGLHLVLRQIIDSFATSDQHPLVSSIT